jgi:hypothetical protein
MPAGRLFLTAMDGAATGKCWSGFGSPIEARRVVGGQHVRGSADRSLGSNVIMRGLNHSSHPVHNGVMGCGFAGGDECKR